MQYSTDYNIFVGIYCTAQVRPTASAETIKYVYLKEKTHDENVLIMEGTLMNTVQFV